MPSLTTRALLSAGNCCKLLACHVRIFTATAAAALHLQHLSPTGSSARLNPFHAPHLVSVDGSIPVKVMMQTSTKQPFQLEKAPFSFESLRQYLRSLIYPATLLVAKIQHCSHLFRRLSYRQNNFRQKLNIDSDMEPQFSWALQAPASSNNISIFSMTCQCLIHHPSR